VNLARPWLAVALLSERVRCYAAEHDLWTPNLTPEVKFRWPSYLACERAIRRFDTFEWTRYIGPGLEFEETCK